jgi:hypothetical protein
MDGKVHGHQQTQSSGLFKDIRVHSQRQKKGL